MKSLKIKDLLIYIFFPIALALVFLIFYYKYNPQVQYNLMILTLLTYLGLSLLYHKMDKSLTLQVVFEYILLGSLTVIVVLGSQIVF